MLPSSTSAIVIELTSAIVHLDTNFTLTGTGELRVSGSGTTAPRRIIDSGRTLTLDNPGQVLNRVENDATIENNGTVQVNTEFDAQLRGNFMNAARDVLNIGSASAFGTFEASGLPTDDTLVNRGTVNLRGTLRVSSVVRNYGTLNITGGGASIRDLANARTLRNETGASSSARRTRPANL